MFTEDMTAMVRVTSNANRNNNRNILFPARFIAGEFQGRFLRIGLRGSIAGAMGALLFFFATSITVSNILPDQSGAQLGALFGSFSLGIEGIIAIGLLIPAIATLTAITSRLTVQRFLRSPS